MLNNDMFKFLCVVSLNLVPLQLYEVVSVLVLLKFVLNV